MTAQKFFVRDAPKYHLVKSIRHLFIGYLLIYLTPVFSILVHLGLLTWISLTSKDCLTPIIAHTTLNTASIAILVAGVTLYILGYQKRQLKNEEASLIFVLSPLLTLWGVFVTFFARGWYLDLIVWSTQPEVRLLTAWDYAEYGSWMLKGVIWLMSGLLLAATSYRKIR